MAAKTAVVLPCLLATLIVISGGYSLTTICVRSSEYLQFNLVVCDVNTSLEHFNESVIKSNIKLLFDNGTHYMKSKLKITNRSNITIAAVDFARIQCTNNSADVGFAFSEVRNLEMRLLRFSDCKTKDAVLTFDKGENISLLDVEITHSKGAGIQCSCVRGKTNLTHFRVLFSTYTSGVTNEFRYNTSCSKSHHNLIIHSSVFANNTFPNQSTKKHTLNFIAYKCNATIKIEHSKLDNNTGGNLGININGIVIQQQVTISYTNITRGNASKGGGLHLKIYELPLHICHKDITAVSIESVWFKENRGSVGGGLFMEQKNHLNVYTSKVIAIQNSQFIGNHLNGNKRGGVALHSITYILRGIAVQTVPQYKPSLINCTFINNTVISNRNDSASGNGVLFINKNAYFGIKNINVTNNNCSAILAVTSNLLFEGNNTLSFNNASSGGGLLLCKNGILYFKPHTTVTIINNTVSHAGGGICVESQCLQTEPRCFYQFEYVNESMLETIKVVVKNNRAMHAGENLFGGLVDYCYMIDDDDLNIRNSTEIYKKIFYIPNNSAALTSSVASVPHRVCLCTTNKLNCSATKHLKLYSGETFNISVMTVGQLDGYVPGDIVAKWTDNSTDIKDLEITQNVNATGHCKVLYYTPRSITNTTTLQLYAAHSGDISGYLRFPDHRPLNISILFRECPTGFENDNSKGCTCCFLDQLKDANCSLSPVPTITKSTGWIGRHNNSSVILVHESCPYDYCKPTVDITNNDFDKQCSYNRAGKLCGKCQKKFSMVLGSSQCRQCSNLNLLLILVFALAGLALVFILTTLNLTIAEGTLSGLVFYANIVWYNHSLFIGTHEKKRNLLSNFIALINLDLDISICLYDGLDAYQKAWLQFIFPTYIWTISIIIIYLSRKSQLIAKIASKNAVKVLATLVLLSYTKFIQASVRVFAYTNLGGCHSDESTKLWLVDANIDYFEKKHLILFTVAVLFVALSLPFMIMLLFIKPLLCVSHKRPFWWIQSLKPFLDAYTGPYTDNGRFWPGLLLLARVTISVVGGISFLESPEKQNLVGLMIIMLLLAISKVTHPGLYLKSLQDLLETFFLLNLGILYLASLHSSIHNTTKHKDYYSILVGLAFVVFVGIVLYHVWLKLRHCRCIVLVFEKIISQLPKRKKKSSNRLSNFPPFAAFTEDREPLLADNSTH